jgi:hypothetical protein
MCKHLRWGQLRLRRVSGLACGLLRTGALVWAVDVVFRVWQHLYGLFYLSKAHAILGGDDFSCTISCAVVK